MIQLKHFNFSLCLKSETYSMLVYFFMSREREREDAEENDNCCAK